MHWIESLRNTFGIKQEELAVYLCVSRSTISLAELGKRDLPAQAMIALAPLLEPDGTAITGDLAAQLQQKQAVAAALAGKKVGERIKTYTAKLATAQRKLAEMKEKCQRAGNALKLAQRLLVLPLEGKTALHRDAFTNSLITNAFETLTDNGPAAQEEIEATIQLCTAFLRGK